MFFEACCIVGCGGVKVQFPGGNLLILYVQFTKVWSSSFEQKSVKSNVFVFGSGFHFCFKSPALLEYIN